MKGTLRGSAPMETMEYRQAKTSGKGGWRWEKKNNNKTTTDLTPNVYHVTHVHDLLSPIKYIKQRPLNFINEEVIHRKTTWPKFTKLLSLTAGRRTPRGTCSLNLYPFPPPSPSTGSSPKPYTNQRILTGTCGIQKAVITAFAIVQYQLLGWTWK